MSKSLLFLLSCFLILLAAYFYVRTLPLGKNISDVMSPTQRPTSLAKTNLTFSPNELSLSASQSGSLDIVITAENATPATVQLELAYNPFLLQNVQLVPGDFFSNPVVVLNTNDTNTGRISYALQASGSPINHSGVVATINFTSVHTFIPTQTAITFLPKTVLKDQNGQIIPIATSEANIKIVNAMFIPQASQSTIMQPIHH